MTEQPNTAALRAWWGEGWPGAEVLVPLCDALDAARAERGEWNAMLNEANERYEAAEARIAAALDICDRADDMAQLPGWVGTDRVRRALTGEK